MHVPQQVLREVLSVPREVLSVPVCINRGQATVFPCCPDRGIFLSCHYIASLRGATGGVAADRRVSGAEDATAGGGLCNVPPQQVAAGSGRCMRRCRVFCGRQDRRAAGNVATYVVVLDRRAVYDHHEPAGDLDRD